MRASTSAAPSASNNFTLRTGPKSILATVALSWFRRPALDSIDCGQFLSMVTASVNSSESQKMDEPWPIMWRIVGICDPSCWSCLDVFICDAGLFLTISSRGHQRYKLGR